MKVLFDHRVPIGGVDRYARQLISAMRATGLVLAEVAERSDGFLTAPFTPWGRWFVGRRAAAGRFDLVHGLHFELPRSHIPSIVTISDLIPLEHEASLPSRLKRWTFKRLVKQACERAEAIIVHSELGKDSLGRLLHTTAPVHVIPIGVAPLFKRLNDEERSTAMRRFGSGGPYIASIYHHKAHKNMVTLEATARILSSTNPVRLAAAGSPPKGSALQGTGRLPDEDLRLFLGGAELMVLPSLLEGFGLPALEAVACGTPVIAGPGLGAAEFLGSAVLVTDVADAEGMAKEIAALLEDTQRRGHMAQAGLEAAARLTVAAEAAAHIDVYRQVTGTGP